MRRKINTILVVSAILPFVVMGEAKAQGGFVQNEENMIQQDAGMGALNSKQTANLQNQEAQIMNQEVIDKNANGGKLTPQERQQIGQETRNLNNSLNYDTHKNNPNMPYQAPNQWNNGSYPGNYQGWRPNGNANWNPGQYNPNNQYNLNNQYNPNYQQQQQNGQYPNNGHHHRRWNNYNNNQ